MASNIIEIEQALLGCLLTDPVKAGLQEIAEYLHPSTFSDFQNARIYFSLHKQASLVKDSKKTLTEAFKYLIGGLNTTADAREIERIKTLLRDLANQCVNPEYAKQYAYALKRTHLKNSMTQAIDDYIEFMVTA